MRSFFGTLIVFCMMMSAGVYLWDHMRHRTSIAPAVPPSQNSEGLTESDGERTALAAQEANAGVESLPSVRVKPKPAEFAGGSRVDTTIPVLNRTFPVRKAVQLQFEVPAHAATPRLNGGYRSFLKAGTGTGEDGAEIEVLVLNESQYREFLANQTGEAVFAAEQSSDQQVNAYLPPTLDQPQSYHLVFRNNSKGPARKFVEADFRVEF